MLAAFHPRISFRRRPARRMSAKGRGEATILNNPRCLGELRLADLLRAGSISHAEFEAERAALLERL